MKKEKSKVNEERRALVSAFEAADSYTYAAMATARDGLENSSSASPADNQKHFLVIEDLLTRYREIIHAAIDGKAA